MGNMSDMAPPDRQLRNMQFVEDRLELLDTIRDMIDVELDRRGLSQPLGRPSPSAPSDCNAQRQQRTTLWQRILNFFNSHHSWEEFYDNCDSIL